MVSASKLYAYARELLNLIYSFIRLIEKQFLAGLIGYDEISAIDFYSLIELLCPDFPQTVIQVIHYQFKYHIIFQ